MASIRKRNGKWVADVTIFGKRKPKSFGTKAEAEAYIRAIALREVDRVTGFREIKDVSVAFAVNEYLVTVTPKKSKRTWYVDRLALTEIQKAFPNTAISEIDLQALERYQTNMLKELNPATVNRKFNVIKNFFKKCQEWNFIYENPTSRIKKLNERPKPKTPVPVDIATKMLEALPLWAARVFYFIAKNSIRRGEACDLKWSDVNWINRSFTVFSEKGGVVRPKTIPLTDEMFDFLLSIFNENKGRPVEYIFMNQVDRQINRNNLTKIITETGKSLGLGNIGVQLLRHTVLTNMSLQNQSGSTIQKLAGHASLTTTQRYLQIKNDDVRDSLEAYSKEYALPEPKLRLVQ